MGHLRGKSRSQREIRCGLKKKIVIWVEGKKYINPSIHMYRNSHVARVNNLEIRAIRPSNRSRRDLKGEMSRIKPRTRLLMSRRGEAEVVKCGRNTSTLTFTLNSHLLSGCPTTASQRGLRTRPRLMRIQKDFQKKKRKCGFYFFCRPSVPAAPDPPAACVTHGRATSLGTGSMSPPEDIKYQLRRA